MRRLTAAVLSLALITAACSPDEQMVQPTGPTGVQNPSSATSPGQQADSAEIARLIEGTSSLIHGLFDTYPSCTGNCNAAMSKFDQIAKLYTEPPPYDMAAVVSHTYDLIDWILAKYHAGSLQTPDGYATTGEGVTAVVNLLYTYAGISASICDLGKTDCDVTFYQPGSPTTTLQAPSGFAQLLAPPGTGTVTQPTVLSVYRLTPDNDLSMLYLATELDQYPLQYEFSTSSGETFLQDVTLSVCLANDVTVPDESRLRLAHNVAEPAPYENIQILPRPTLTGPLSCDTASTTDLQFSATARPSLLRNFAIRGLRALTGVLSPTPLQATMLAGTGITGTSKNLSPFGIVDPLGLISATSTTTITALEGTAVAAPSVKVLTPTQSGMAGIPVTFTITAGGGCFGAIPCTSSSLTTSTVNTDASGSATAPSWTIGLGSNSVSASATIPCSAPVAPGTVADCGTIQTAAGGSAVTFSATGLPQVYITGPATVPNGVVGVAYPASTQLTATGGDGSYSFALTSGSSLPAGLSLSSGGLLSGTPSAAGTFSFTVQVTSGPLTNTMAYSVTIYPAPSITAPATLPVGIQGAVYPSNSFAATGGDGSYSWSLASGSSLPAGLTLSSGGVLGGTPTASGSFNFSVQVTSGPVTSPATATRSYSVTIHPPVAITTASPLPTAIIGLPYAPPALQASGGTGSFTWSGSALPSWLGLSGASLSGTPTTAAAGTSTFGITATSTVGSVSASATKQFSLTVGYPTAVNVSFVTEPSAACHAVDAIIGNGTATDPYVQVKVTTTTGTPLSGVPVNIIAVLNNGSTVVVSEPSDTTNASGVAIFSSLSINKSGAYQLRVGTTSPWPVTNVLSNKFKISPKC
jgi:hypothetical protein